MTAQSLGKTQESLAIFFCDDRAPCGFRIVPFFCWAGGHGFIFNCTPSSWRSRPGMQRNVLLHIFAKVPNLRVCANVTFSAPRVSCLDWVRSFPDNKVINEVVLANRRLHPGLVSPNLQSATRRRPLQQMWDGGERTDYLNPAAHH